MKDDKIYLSVIIPVYNESRRLYNLSAIVDFLAKQKFSWEIIVVNDGSTDTTLSQLKKMASQQSVQIISYEENQGKGFAVKTGMLNAQGEYRIFMDIDLSTPIGELDKFMPLLGKHDVIIATRKTQGSTLIARQPKLRETLGKGFTFLSRALLGVKVSDFTCGFKCFSRTAAKEIFSRLTINRWGFDSELLFISKKLNYKIKEVTVIWKNDPQTKVKFPQDIINSLADLTRIRLNDLRNYYNKSAATESIEIQTNPQSI